MRGALHPAGSSTDENRALLVPAALLFLIAVFPPEVFGESMIGCAALAVLFAAVSWPGRLDAPRAWPLVLALAALFPWMLIALAPGAVPEAAAPLLLGTAVGLAAACLPKDLRAGPSLPLVIATAAGAVSLIAIIQKVWGLDAVIAMLERSEAIADRTLLLERARAGRVSAWFPTPAALGGYLVISLPVTLAGVFGLRGRLRWVLLALAVLQVAALIGAQSVSATAALLGAAGLFALARPQTRRRALVAVGVLILALAGVALLRGAEVLDPGARGPWKLRAANFRLAGEVIADHPWTGVGPGGFGEVYPQYRQQGDNETRHVHDLPLELSADLGVPAGLFLAAIFFYLFVGPLFRRTRESPPWWRGAEVGLAAFALHNLADFTAFLPSVLWTATILRGWIARRETLTWAPASRLPVALALAGTLGVATVAGLSGWSRNDRSAARAAALEQRAEEAAVRARAAARHAPWNADAWMLAAQAGLDAPRDERPRERLERALADVERAVAASPVRPSARYLRSRLRLALGDTPGAYADAAEAARLYPHREKYLSHRDEMAAGLPRPETAPGPGR